MPPLVHTDDPTRAVLACFDMVKVFEKLNLKGRFGVTTGRSYCLLDLANISKSGANQGKSACWLDF